MSTKKILTFVIPLLVFGCVENKETTDLVDQPNILLIVADDLGYTDIGSFGTTDLFTDKISSYVRL
jgi:hypothetical protein